MIKVKKVVHIEGIGKIAELYGVTASHLSRVAHGKRKSKRLADALMAHGIKVEKYKGE